jgi:peptidoglycan-N-acetylglucosamine deacetylase
MNPSKCNLVGPLLTTSWDDGNPLDLRLAELLARYQVKGTFYIPSPQSGLKLLSHSQIRSLHTMGMELGAHTMTHAVLPGLDSARIRREVLDGKQWLEDILGEPVKAFCFPLGKFNRRACQIVEECGFQLARTTVAFNTGLDFAPFQMPVSLHFWPHSRQIHIRHALKEGNWQGLRRWCFQYQARSDLESLTEVMMEDVKRTSGVLHIWGHSWELEQRGLWPVLESTLRRLSEGSTLKSVVNSELIAPSLRHAARV